MKEVSNGRHTTKTCTKLPTVLPWPRFKSLSLYSAAELPLMTVEYVWAGQLDEGLMLRWHHLEVLSVHPCHELFLFVVQVSTKV